MSNTATAQATPDEPITITPDVKQEEAKESPQKSSFLAKALWLLFIFSGLSIGYYAWQTQLQQQAHAESVYKTELAEVKQEIATLKKAYNDLLAKQTSVPADLLKKVSALEAKLLTVGTATEAATPDYLHDILALIALKDINHKIETGVPFRADVKILEYTPSKAGIDVQKLKTASSKRFTTLDQLQIGLRTFEDHLELKKEAEEKSIIAQMGDFLKISRSVGGEDALETSEILDNAEAALNLDDIGQAAQILRAAFPEPTEAMQEWFKDADSYLAGRELRAELEGWASQLFKASEAAEG